ncbi:hypothetical protein [Paenibacillus sedimenti]|uniref:Uncharacterized protein n=1 Tax=Paenibacillus sedimenti TaxID=2770274 RepID=A0A926KLV1_9BACL|nr:hypothetical protein [Paenibacillus sedimenti]MBD0380194.1 hypothetical protein [Paenibacillus sedimenti]
MEIKLVVESIVRELVKTMQTEAVKPPKLLYIFCDSTAQEAYLDHFILLQKNGIEHDILFLDGETSAWLGKHKIESGAPGKIILADEYAPAPIEVPMDYAGIVIPEIDLDNAGRVALGMKGTVKSEIIFSALVLGKFVLVGDDASGLKRTDRRTLQALGLPKSYQNLFEYYKKEMQMYGVDFAPVKQLAEVAVRKCAASKGGQEEGSLVSVVTTGLSEDATETILTFEGKLVSAEWVKQQPQINRTARLTLAKGTILSPLAKDMLREKGIAVQFKDEG